MIFYPDLCNQITPRPLFLTQMPHLGKIHPATIIYPRRDLERNDPFLSDPALARTKFAMLNLNLPNSPAAATRLRKSRRGNSNLDLPGSATMATDFPGSLGVKPLSRARNTGDLLEDMDPFYGPMDGALKVNLQGAMQVFAPLG
jgi:hypothetical protein